MVEIGKLDPVTTRSEMPVLEMVEEGVASTVGEVEGSLSSGEKVLTSLSLDQSAQQPEEQPSAPLVPEPQSPQVSGTASAVAVPMEGVVEQVIVDLTADNLREEEVEVLFTSV